MVAVQGTWQFISTWQLLDPGKTYTVSDELESLFFVFLYEGVHWITHNKPGTLNVEHIFDDVQFNTNGQQTGGAGKLTMYTMNANVLLCHLNFMSPPFTKLIRELFRLFQSLAGFNIANRSLKRPDQDDTANVKKLEDCRAIKKMIMDTMKRKDWPEACDKATKDNYPRKLEVGSVDRIGLANLKLTTAFGLNASTNTTPSPTLASTSQVLKRKHENSGNTLPTKRSRVKAG